LRISQLAAVAAASLLLFCSVSAVEAATMFTTTSPFLVGIYAAEILSVCGVLLYVIYQCFFSPLAKYPGPFWAKLTKLYRANLSLRGHAHRDFIALHKKYGNIVRVAPNELYFALFYSRRGGACFMLNSYTGASQTQKPSERYTVRRIYLPLSFGLETY
jgi:hypothetical protein